MRDDHSADPPPGQTPNDAVDDLTFDVLVEAAELAHSDARLLRNAALRRDRARARLYSCTISRCIRAALECVADLDRRRRA